MTWVGVRTKPLKPWVIVEEVLILRDDGSSGTAGLYRAEDTTFLMTRQRSAAYSGAHGWGEYSQSQLAERAEKDRTARTMRFVDTGRKDSNGTRIFAHLRTCPLCGLHLDGAEFVCGHGKLKEIKWPINLEDFRPK